MKYVPHITLQDAGASLKVILVNNADLIKDKPYTLLSEDVVSTGTTIRVQSILGFESVTTGSGQIIWIGGPGEERSEILRTSNSTSPSSSYKEVTLRDTLQFDHPQDTKVYIIDWNRVEVDYSATATGSKTTIAAYPYAIQPDHKNTLVRDITEPANRVGSATVFYFARYNENIGGRNSDWSDPVYGTGFDDNMVGAIKQRALDELNETVDGDVITHEFLNNSLWEARREYHKAPGKRPFRRKYNFNIGTALTGSFRIELPVDIEKGYGAENVYGVRIGTEANMLYYDKKEWDFDFSGKPHTSLVSAYVRGARDLYVADCRDFAGSGVVSIEGAYISYSAKSNSGGTLRISADGAWDCSAGSDVWQNPSYGLPDKFTVWQDSGGSAYIYFNRIIDTAYVNQNIYADYYRTLVGYDSDGDVLDEPDYDMYVHYLKAKIKAKKNRGESDITKDPDFKLWHAAKANALGTEFLSAEIRANPDVEHLPLAE